MQRQNLITLHDAAVVVRSQDGKVKVRQAVNLVGAGALGGAFWGMLIGLLFLAPWLGACWSYLRRHCRQDVRLWHRRQLHQGGE
jgi:uncharacterized membrane protein